MIRPTTVAVDRGGGFKAPNELNQFRKNFKFTLIATKPAFR